MKGYVAPVQVIDVQLLPYLPIATHIWSPFDLLVVLGHVYTDHLTLLATGWLSLTELNSLSIVTSVEIVVTFVLVISLPIPSLGVSLECGKSLGHGLSHRRCVQLTVISLEGTLLRISTLLRVFLCVAI